MMLHHSTPGKIILLNGASSAGKSTLALALQQQLAEPFLQFSLDFFMFQTDVLPKRREEAGAFSWPVMRAKLWEGYFNCLPALAFAGNNLVIDYILESSDQLHQLTHLLAGFDVFFVGVHCQLPELERRERQRGDRGIGDARQDLRTVHSFSSYDWEVNTEKSPDQTAAELIRAWDLRRRPSVFDKLLKGFSQSGNWERPGDWFE